VAAAGVVSALVVGCALQPRHGETLWVTVAYIYTLEALQKSWNAGLASSVKGAGLTDEDVSAGRVIRVACGLGSNHTWGSHAYLPQGMTVRRDDVLELRIEDPREGSTLGWNPVVGRVERFKYPGSSRAYLYVPDWKERGLETGFERISLQPGQRGRYEMAYGEYVIKCRQGD
jgi:hypothetical protein